MNKLVCLLLLLLAGKIGVGQNIIQNPSFEDTVACPFFYSQIDFASGCYYFRGSPDYFNDCSVILMGVPVNDVGYQFPRTGNAYAGLINYAATDSLYREWIGMQLLQPLVIGVQYNISFFANMAYEPNASSLHITTATNKLGARFSTGPIYWNNTLPLNGYATIYTDSVIADTLNWVEIHGSFIADSAYNYLVIGNFFNDSTMSHTSLDSVNAFSYYFIDDVCVSDSTDFCYIGTGLNEATGDQAIVLFPNPFTNELTVTVKGNKPVEITLYDIASRKIKQQKFTGTLSINTQSLAKGIYLYELKNKNSVIKNGKLVKD